MKIPSLLLPKDIASALKLQEQAYIILIPKKILTNAGISNTPEFDLIFDKNKLALVTSRKAEQESDHSSEVIT